MRPRFLADADLSHKIVLGIRRREPGIDFQGAQEGGVIGLSDPEVLAIARDVGRILVSSDKNTMPGHFADFHVRHSSPGIIIVPQGMTIGAAIEDLILIWATTDSREWSDRVGYLPL